MLVVGIFIAAYIPLYSLYIENSRRDETRVSQVILNTALQSFKEIRGRLPCPARYDAVPGEEDYGVEVECFGSTVAPGNCTDGICYEISERTYLVDGAPFTPRVERGMLPFKTLGLREEQAYDAYGGRFSYAVTEILTDKKSYRNNRGGISIVDGSEPHPHSLTEEPASAQFYVFSHGPDQIGAYNRSGFEVVSCNGPMLDNENCYTTSAHKTARYRHTLQSTERAVTVDSSVVVDDPSDVTEINTHFDDFADFSAIGKQPMWEYGEDSQRKPKDSVNLHESIKKKVIVGTDEKIADEDDSLSLLVGGINANVKTRQNGRSEELCNSGSGQDCMPSAVIGADDEDDPRALRCPAGTVATKISGNKFVCKTPSVQGCPEGDLPYGFDNNGLIMCRGESCPTIPVQICDTTVMLPDKAKPNSTKVLTGGASRTQTYTCKGGEWTETSSSGVCDCTAGSVTTGGSCGANMSGQTKITTTTVCPAGTTTETVDNSACKCVESTKYPTEGCPSGYASGWKTYKEVTICVNNVPQTTRTLESNTCTCKPEHYEENMGCPAGYGGSKMKYRDSVCTANGAVWGDWVIKDECTCSNKTETKEEACGTGYNLGKKIYTCKTVCPSDKTQPATTSCELTENSCDCQPTVVPETKTCPSGYTGTYTDQVLKKCDGTSEIQSTTKGTDCKPATMTCTVQKKDFQSFGKVKWSVGDKCTYTGSDNECTKITACTVPLGSQYAIYSCSCQ
ncbi:MAG: hypothetical protein DI551_04130 [Micavibrio aeruginosavorus]|uniref:Uncharacterized protein n=1 Tax=Micavibrio aeruginosavorus TaxID=349221 RepID=A0A2W5PQJ1_9BACT|nr:MAG: hypothetical protein DI551_04130 [Micavibrio aeruginosavorus]